jgi:histone H1/5
MPRACLPQNLRPSDIIRISANGKGKSGRRTVVVSREAFDATVKVLYRGIVKGANGEHISETVEGFTSLSNRVLYPIEGIWEGELVPGAAGRTVEYDNTAYKAPRSRGKSPQKGEAKVPTKPKGRPARKPAAKKSAPRAERATDAQLDKDAARVVKMRDSQNKSWAEIEEATGIAASRLRQLYNRGGGAPSATKAKPSGGRAASKKAAPARGRAAKAKTGGRGKRNPS